MIPKTIDGGFEVSIRGGVMWINSREGSILRISGLPRHIDVEFVDVEGKIFESMNGT